ncbi:MAG: hypothetical protein L0Y66_18600 [Myxococcaceae bacterium]|nr:hypothetical protein [Myxococcaceae bacterium]MCI0670317.1 hypothetical protein [Myxococcaceae bacterium]
MSDTPSLSSCGCPSCGEARARLEEVLQERDVLHLELARAREELDRLRLAEVWVHEEDIPLYPLEAGAAWPVPARYRMVDAVNAWVKRAAPRVQRIAKAWTRRGHGG